MHDRFLLIVYSDKKSTFEKLLETDRSLLIHTKNLQILATEFFKETKDLTSTIFSEIFSKRCVHYNLRHASKFSVPNVKSTFPGIKSLSNVGPKIWDLVPKELKELSNLSAFKKAIEKWETQNCPCRICKKYLKNLDFIWYFFLTFLIFIIVMF